mgnify:CR=1 FL=1
MTFSRTIALSTLAAALIAGNAWAQRVKVAPAPVYFDDAYEVILPGDNGVQLKLEGLKSVRAVWMTFSAYADGKPARDVSRSIAYGLDRVGEEAALGRLLPPSLSMGEAIRFHRALSAELAGLSAKWERESQEERST